MKNNEAWLLCYLVNSLWQVPVAFAAGWVVARLLRSSGPRIEHRVWIGTLGLAVLLPACHVSLGSLAHMLWSSSRGVVDGWAQVAMVADTAEPHGVLRFPSAMLAIVAVLYGCSLLISATRLAWGVWKTTRMRRHATPAVLPEEPARSWTLCRDAFKIHGARLAISPQVFGPVIVGLRSRLLLVPPGFLETVAAPDLLAALAHEFAHMQRRDFGKNLFYVLLSLPVAYHPALWLLRTRLAESREMVCDAMAAEALGGSEPYARSLLRLASMLSGQRQATPLHAIGIFDANTLERRVMHLTRKHTETKGARRFASAAACVVIGFATCASALSLRFDVGDPAVRAGNLGQVQDNSTDANRGYEMDGDVYLFKPGGPIHAPKLTYSVDPEFPKYSGKLTGVCVLSTVVNTQGMPEQVMITKSLRKDFDDKAIEVVKQYRFKPGTLDGKPVLVRIHIEVNFQRF